jgi:5-methylcytosine-specific restriction protein A
MSSAADRRFYTSKAWRDLREVVLNAEPLCRHCAKKGITKPATEIDHIQPRKIRPDLELDYNNTQPLCFDCHVKKTVEENRKKPTIVVNSRYSIQS